MTLSKYLTICKLFYMNSQKTLLFFLTFLSNIFTFSYFHLLKLKMKKNTQINVTLFLILFLLLLFNLKNNKCT